MEIWINPGAELSIYRQIMRQIVEAIAGGRLAPGEKLPSHRELSEQIVVAPLTVKKAYDELEGQGYIETQRGRGTFVSEKLPRVRKPDQLLKIEEAARQLLSLAYLGGIDLSEIFTILRSLDRDLTGAASRAKEKV